VTFLNLSGTVIGLTLGTWSWKLEARALACTLIFWIIESTIQAINCKIIAFNITRE